MKVAFVVPCRNKVANLERSIWSVFEQTYTPMQIVLSDQGSTDGTRELLDKLASSYKGPNTITILDCPLTEAVGMHGLNVHLNWIHQQIDADIVVCMSADDLALPKRTERVVAAFIEHDADMIMNAVITCKPDCQVIGVNLNPKQSGFVTPRDCLEGLCGGSTGHSWKTSFFHDVGGFDLLPGFDSYFPYLACVRGKGYYLHEQLTVYFNYADSNNTGLEGVMRAAKTQEEFAQVNETVYFELSASHMAALKRLDAWDVHTEEARQPLYERILVNCIGWTQAREALTLSRIPPIPLRA